MSEVEETQGPTPETTTGPAEEEMIGETTGETTDGMTDGTIDGTEATTGDTKGEMTGPRMTPGAETDTTIEEKGRLIDRGREAQGEDLRERSQLATTSSETNHQEVDRQEVDRQEADHQGVDLPEVETSPESTRPSTTRPSTPPSTDRWTDRSTPTPSRTTTGPNQTQLSDALNSKWNQSFTNKD